MSRKPTKPKKLKFPKKPKASAPLSSWERYDDKCKEVEKKNSDRDREYKKALKTFEDGRKKKESLIKKHRG